MYSIPEAEVENPPAWAVDHVGLVRNKIQTWHEQNGRCCYCYVETWLKPYSTGSSRFEATAEHIKPRAQGGLNNYQNIVMACKVCNNERDQMDALEYWEIKQCPIKYAAWKAEKAREVSERKSAKNARNKKRRDAQWSADAAEFGLTKTNFKNAIDFPEMTVWDAINISHSIPWNRSLCLLLKLWQLSPGGTVKPVLSSKSPLFRIALWLYKNPTSHFRLATT